MPRRGTVLSPDAAERQALATREWHAENTELLKFTVRVPKGRRSAYRELAQARGESLTSIVKSYLDAQCAEHGINV